MTEWTEEWVRGATGWKPFKEGKALLEHGRVSALQCRDSICQGVFKEGRLTLRTTVKVLSPTDVRVQCGCPENRATGGICAHAVAVLLAAIPSSAPAAKTAAATPVPAAAPRPSSSTNAPARAWEIRISPRFAEELAAGRLSVRLLAAGADVLPDPADRLLSAVLPAGARPPQALPLGPELLAPFLDAVAGHPRVAVEGGAKGEDLKIEPDPAPPLRLRDSRWDGRNVVLEIEPPAGRLFRWGDSPALAVAGKLAKLPSRHPDATWHAQVAKLAGGGRLELPVAAFLERFDAWLDLFESPPAGWLGELRLTAASPAFVLELDGSLDALEALLSVRYPGLQAVPLPAADQELPGLPRLAEDHRLLARQPVAEKAAARRLQRAGFTPGPAPGRFRLRGREEVLAFLADELPGLQALWEVRQSGRFEAAAARVQIVRPEIRRIGGEGASLSFELSFQTTQGERMSGDEVRRLLRGSRRVNRRPDGREVVLSRSCGEVVQPLVEEFGVGRPDAPFQLSGAAAFGFDHLRKYLLKSIESNDLSHNEEEFSGEFRREGLAATLRDYQWTGARWLAGRLSTLGGALLADEMGLGKTLQTIAAINHFRQEPATAAGESRAPCLIAVPASLVGNWQAELAKFAPGLSCVALHGTGRDRLRDQVDRADVVVTSYGTLVRDLAFHLQREYRLIVADEASLLRNAATDVSKALFKLQARGRIALTGTPVENRVRDLWAVFRFIAPGYLGSLTDFQERYETPTADGEVPRGLLERLRLRISPFVLRRTKQEVAGDLPEKLEIDEWLSLEPGQAKLYASLARTGLAEIEKVRERQGEAAGRMHLLTLLLRLRQVCVDPALLKPEDEEAESSAKTARLLELLENQFENQSKTLVFSQFSLNLRNLERRLGSDFGAVYRLDGATRNRQELVERFQQQPGAAVFLISLKAGGYGLNLTAADTVIHLDPWWNPAVEAQATDRAHRIGQTQPVTVYRLLTRDTVEERVRRMQERKRAIIDATTTEGSAPGNWTQDDLEELLR